MTDLNAHRVLFLFSRSLSRRRVLMAIVAVLVVVHALFIAAPIRYAGTFMTIGEGILDGQLPYIDFIDHKPPGVYYIFALALAAYNSAYTIKILMISATLISGGLVYLLGKHLSSKEGGLIAAALYFAGSVVYEGIYFHQESLVVPFALIGTWVLFRAESKSSKRYVAGAGLAFGISALFKQPGFLFIPAGGVYLLWTGWSTRRSEAATDAIIFSVAGALPITLWGMYFLSVGGLSEFLHWVFYVNLPGGAYGGQSLKSLVGGAVMNALRFPLAWALTLAGVTSAVQTQSDSRFRFLVLALVAAAVPLSVRNFDHYWLLLLPFAALLSVRPAVELLNRLDAGRVAQNSQVIIMSAFLFLALPVGLHIADTGMSAYGVDGPEGVVTIETQDRIGTQIAEQTNPDDQIVTLGEQHEYYFFADRRPASRNLYYLSVNRDWYSQEGIIRLLGQPNVTYVVIGAPYQEEIARVSQYVQSNQSSYRLVGRYYDSQDEILLYRKESA